MWWPNHLHQIPISVHLHENWILTPVTLAKLTTPTFSNYNVHFFKNFDLLRSQIFQLVSRRSVYSIIHLFYAAAGCCKSIFWFPERIPTTIFRKCDANEDFQPIRSLSCIVYRDIFHNENACMWTHISILRKACSWKSANPARNARIIFGIFASDVIPNK